MLSEEEWNNLHPKMKKMYTETFNQPIDKVSNKKSKAIVPKKQILIHMSPEVYDLLKVYCEKENKIITKEASRIVIEYITQNLIEINQNLNKE